MTLGTGLRGKGVSSRIAGRWIGIECRVARAPTQIDEHARHAGKHLSIFDHCVEIARIGERPCQMMANLGDAGLKCRRRIPNPAIRRIEATGFAGFGIGKASVDEPRVRNTVDQFVRC